MFSLEVRGISLKDQVQTLLGQISPKASYMAWIYSDGFLEFKIG